MTATKDQEDRYIEEEIGGVSERKRDLLPPYQAPRVITYSEDDLIERVGPVQACTPFSVA